MKADLLAPTTSPGKETAGELPLLVNARPADGEALGDLGRAQTLGPQFADRRIFSAVDISLKL
jgi:hypothetical protein